MKFKTFMTNIFSNQVAKKPTSFYFQLFVVRRLNMKTYCPYYLLQISSLVSPVPNTQLLCSSSSSITCCPISWRLHGVLLNDPYVSLPTWDILWFVCPSPNPSCLRLTTYYTLPHYLKAPFTLLHSTSRVWAGISFLSRGECLQDHVSPLSRVWAYMCAAIPFLWMGKHLSKHHVSPLTPLKQELSAAWWRQLLAADQRTFQHHNSLQVH